MKNLFIDSNIWLSLYHFTSDDLTQFEKLKDFLDKDIRLWIPHQVYDEVLRNREAMQREELLSCCTISCSNNSKCMCVLW